MMRDFCEKDYLLNHYLRVFKLVFGPGCLDLSDSLMVSGSEVQTIKNPSLEGLFDLVAGGRFELPTFGL